MNRILKVFASGTDQDQLAAQYPVIERYEGFVLLEAPDEAAPALATSQLVEDVTDQYQLELGGKTVNTASPKSRGSALAGRRRVGAPPVAAPVKKAPDTARHHYLVQFIGPMKKSWLAGVTQAGGEPREPYRGYTYVVRATGKAVEKISQLPYVRWIGHLPHADRIAGSVRLGRAADDISSALPRTKVIPGVYVVEFFGEADAKAAVPKAKKLGLQVLQAEPAAKLLIVEASDKKAARTKQLKALSAVHGVRQISERTLDRPSNDVAAGLMGTATVMSNPGLGLSGKGEVIGVCDTGLDTGDKSTIHADFRNRVSFIKSYPLPPDLNSFVKNPGADDGAADLDSGHGTHVAGSVLGSGAGSLALPGVTAPIRGLAYRAKLVFQAVEQETKWKNPVDYINYGRYGLWGIPNHLKTLFQDAYTKKARIHSNSWGGGKPGEYDAQCRQLDQFVWDHKDFCILVAAGNDGTDKDGDGQINPMSVTSPGTAKNCITVGASENLRPAFNSEQYGGWWPDDYPVAPLHNDPMANNAEQLAAFSSRGPTEDKRFKPDVVAPGTFVLSTRSTRIAANNKAWAAYPQSKLYFHMGGTSMATPLAAGAVALIRQFLRTKKSIAKPSAALLKAAAIAGATRLTGVGPAGAVVDNDQGYGRLNLDAVLVPAAPSQANFLDVSAGLQTGQLWTRSMQVQSSTAPLRIVLAYSDYPGPNLVNNLNLIVTAPNGKKHVGNAPLSGTPTLDAANNVELVHVPSPSAGPWKIEVVASNVPHGPQDFALVWLGAVS
ncbi:MAG: S8 family serine peptidase [Planctomycetaceae bacterium]|nr:S8 family serine peptidase [Planctomycetaceae bacterium]